MGNLHVAIPWTAVLTLAHSSDITSSLVTMQSWKQSSSALNWVNMSWQACIQCASSCCTSTRGTHLAQTYRYSNVATIISNALKLIFSSVHSSLPVIRWFVWKTWLRCSSFYGVTAVHGSLECGLSFMALSPLLKCTVHPSLCSHPTASVNECQWAPFFLHGGIQFHTGSS